MIRHFRRLLVIGAGVVALVAATPASAHIQVLPGEVAPADPVLFTVLVPGETSAGTTRVELKVPRDTYPFSFEDSPGWKRQLIKKPSGLIDRIVWTGKAAPDGLVRFTFLAGTPEKPTTIRWPAIQTYANGQKALWIGDPESDNPAPVTVVSETASRQNAGGEGEEGAQPTSGSTQPEAGSKSENETDWPLTVAALLGFFFGLSSLVILLVNRKSLGQGR